MTYRIRKDGTVIDLTSGKEVRNVAQKKDILERANALPIPPAYTHVEVSKSPQSKVLACGQDAKKRKQCIYNPSFVARMQRQRFAKIERYDPVFKAIAKHVQHTVKSFTHATTASSSVEYQICMILHLMLLCNFRIGNEKYASKNGSYGLTTLEWRHVTKIHRDHVTIRFIGKKGVENVAVCKDPWVCRFLTQNRHNKKDTERIFAGVTSRQVNEWLQTFHKDAPDITSKDLRTWQANRLFEKYVKIVKDTKEAVQRVAEDLHHTAAVCRKNYLDPRLLATK